ncbi:hypothetical protein [Macrococcoides caseolyticum]|uniref:hypothetical protein n=1 Tax=Macrococcoides caseolyticum TaxID=69966 RepID=UPI001F2BBB62|nr:hypothetical protein [Macrococcus caseolyticus]MCE4955727.1 hypothetical protein [Macrococcus caseolyticus]
MYSKTLTFQNALIYIPGQCLISYHTQLKKFFVIDIIQVIGVNTYQVQLRAIHTGEALIAACAIKSTLQGFHILSQQATKQYIATCLKKKSVLQPTLSALYQLRIDRRNIPDELRVVIPEQMHIRTHPIEWQSQLLMLIKTGQFSLERWVAILNLTEQSSCYMIQEQLAIQILEKYQHISNQLRAILTEK